MKEFKMLSLFDGSGGFPLAGALSGITPVAASEIEPFPIRVTTKRFPSMKHLGDVSQINGAEIEPVDVITFGSPCQDLSVAGQRAGMKHTGNGDEETTRSGLFMEAVRIIKEMRCKTNGEYPTFAVWENVPGAYSSNKGEDFRVVLEELAKVKEAGVSIPKSAKWLLAGEIVGEGYSIAWRTLDAQYWGVPQRRRRIYLVADFTGQCAGKILFERTGLRGNIAESGAQGERTSGDAENGTAAADRAVVYDGSAVTSPINVQNPQPGDPCHTLNTDSRNYLVYEMTHADEVIRECKYGLCPTLQARMGTGGNQVPLVMEKPVICLQGNGIDRADTAGCNGRGWNDKTCYTLNTIDRPAVCYAIDRAAFNQGINAQYDISIQENLMQTCVAKVPNAVCYGIGNGQADQAGLNREKVGCLNCMHDQQAVLIDEEPHYIVRRLTPLECCRLQGFPGCWTMGLETAEPTEEDLIFWREVFEIHRKIVTGAKKPKTDKQIIKWLQNPYSDSAEYKMWGNGICLQNALYVMQGIAEELRDRNDKNKLVCWDEPCSMKCPICCFDCEEFETCPEACDQESCREDY